MSCHVIVTCSDIFDSLFSPTLRDRGTPCSPSNVTKRCQETSYDAFLRVSGFAVFRSFQC